MALLQIDRKSNMDLLEANKNINKEEVKKLREENSLIRTKLAQLQKTSATTDESQEEKHITREVDKMRKIHDELKLRSGRLKKELDSLKDSVKDLELESQKPHMEDNEFTRRIRALENKLDKAMIKYNEAQSIRKTYEQIVKRLREERVGFDNQLQAIERTLSSKERDHEELLLLSGDATHAREVAQGELERVKDGYEEERKRRELELRERHQVVQLRRQMIERTRQRERMKTQIAEKEGLSQAAAASIAGMNQKQLAVERLEAKNKIDIFESAFRKIKEATGVSDVNEVIQKIVSQEGTTENLIALTRENQAKIESMNEQKRKMKARVEEIKYSGVGGGHRRKMVDDHEDQLATSTARLERSRLKYERLNKSLIALKAGVGHLQDKLDIVRDDFGGARVEVADDTVTEAMKESEHILASILKQITANKDSMRRDQLMNLESTGLDEDEEAVGGEGLDDAFPEEELEASGRPYNQRIQVNYDEMGGGESSFVTDNDYDAQEADEEELTRDKVKRASKQITESIDRKKRKPRGGTKSNR